MKVKGIMASLQKQFAAIPEAIVFPFNIPTLSGFGAAAGFNFLLQDRSGTMTVQQLGEQTQKFMAAGRQRPELANLNTSFDPNYPQIKVTLDREKARTLGVPVDEVFKSMSSFLGGAFVNDFNRFGRLYRVYVQADSGARLKPEDIGKIYVKSKTTGEMIPLSTLVTVNDAAGDRDHDPVQPDALRGDHRGARQRIYVRAGDEDTRGSLRADHAERNELCVQPTVLSGESGAAICADFDPGHRGRLPAARGVVRKLEAAMGGPAGLATGSAGRLLWGLADGHGQQRLCAGRPDHADRPGGQECNSDCGVCQGEARRRACRSRMPRSTQPACASAPS